MADTDEQREGTGRRPALDRGPADRTTPGLPRAPTTRAASTRADRRRGGSPAPSGHQATPPWRTEGVPPAAGAGARKPWWRRLWVLLVIGYLAVFGLLSLQDAHNGPKTISYTAFTTQVTAGNVGEIYSQGNTIQGTLKSARAVPGQESGTYTEFTTERPTFADDDLYSELSASGATVRATPVTSERGTFSNLLISLLPIALLVAFYVWLFRRQRAAGGMGGMGMGGMLGGGAKKSPVDPTTVRVTFDDVAGIDEVKGEISEVVDFLKDPDKYRALGARAPRGVLLAGAPGTGKTLLARATAGEAGVPFFSASASEFIEMIVGVGARRVRELFAEARKVAPAIIFIDEIDTIGRSRAGARSMGGHDESEQTLNQILTEMDGFSGTEGVIVMGATNRPEVLDPALLRPGRFDRTIQVHAPDARGRAQVLRVHSRSVPLARDVDLDRVAASTPGMTGADLANLVNEAALGAARSGAKEVTASDLSQALEKVQLGTARTVVMPPAERRRTAYHEAGHALLGMLQPGADPVRKVSIIPRGRALGVTLSTPDTDRYGYDEEYLRGRIIGALGGMAAEAEVYGVTTTGAESDLETATSIARQMIGRWGMSRRIGPITALPADGDPRGAGASAALLDAVDVEVRALIEECYATARELLAAHRDQLQGIVDELLVHETLDEEAVYAAAGIDHVMATHLLPGSEGERPALGGTAGTGGSGVSAPGVSAPGGEVVGGEVPVRT